MHDCMSVRNYMNIGSLSRHVLSIDGDDRPTLTYENGDKCDDKRRYKTVIKLSCDEQVSSMDLTCTECCCIYVTSAYWLIFYLKFIVEKLLIRVKYAWALAVKSLRNDERVISS